MKSLPTLAAAAALFTGFMAPASAAASDFTSLGTAGGWSISADHEFCHALKTFANGSSLNFGLFNDGRARIYIDNENWNIPEGNYPVVVSVDRMAPTTFDAKAKGNVVSLAWKLTADEINIMSSGAVFRATVGRQSYQFNLAGSAEMLKALGQCISTRMAAANPFAGTPPAAASKTPPASADTPSNPFRRL